MAITAYVGAPGSGKSYSVVCHVILPAVKQGRVVMTNIPMNISEFEESNRLLINTFDITKFSSDKDYFQSCIIAGAVVVIDECWKWLPAGLQANRIPEHHKAFLAEHRHMVDSEGRSTDICLVTQDLSQLAAFPRQLIEKTFRTVKLLGLGTRSKFRVDIYEGAITGQSPPKTKLLSKSHLQSYQPDIYKFYKSHTLSDSASKGAIEVSTDERGSIFGGFLFKFGIPLAVVFVIIGIWGVSRFFNPKTEPKIEPVTVQAPAPTAQLPKPVSVPSVPVKPSASESAYSESMQIVGVLGYVDFHTGLNRLWVLVSANRARPFRIPFASKCKYLVPGVNQTIECDYQNQKITYTTGSSNEYSVSTKDIKDFAP